ncbi:hypothetical protein LguiA_028794 [Lonicera macranthoides]
MKNLFLSLMKKIYLLCQLNKYFDFLNCFNFGSQNNIIIFIDVNKLTSKLLKKFHSPNHMILQCNIFTVLAFKGSFPCILGTESNLVIAIPKIDFGE